MGNLQRRINCGAADVSDSVHLDLFAQGVAVDAKDAGSLHLVIADPAKNLHEQRFFNFRHDQLMHIVGLKGPDLIEEA